MIRYANVKHNINSKINHCHNFGHDGKSINQINWMTNSVLAPEVKGTYNGGLYIRSISRQMKRTNSFDKDFVSIPNKGFGSLVSKPRNLKLPTTKIVKANFEKKNRYTKLKHAMKLILKNNNKFRRNRENLTYSNFIIKEKSNQYRCSLKGWRSKSKSEFSLNGIIKCVNAKLNERTTNLRPRSSQNNKPGMMKKHSLTCCLGKNNKVDFFIPSFLININFEH